MMVSIQRKRWVVTNAVHARLKNDRDYNRMKISFVLFLGYKKTLKYLLSDFPHDPINYCIGSSGYKKLER